MSCPTSPLTAADVKARVDAQTAAAFRHLTRTSQTGRDVHTLTLSGVGACARRAAHTIARTPPSDPPGHGEQRAANLGTALHTVILPAMAAGVPGARVEVPVTLRAAGLQLTGTADWLWTDPVTGDTEVGDLKTVREWMLHGIVRAAAATFQHRLQVIAYALAAAQAGHRVRWVWWLYLDRSTGRTEVIVEEFTNAAAWTVVQRLTQLAAAAADPDAAPREARGPGLAPSCDHCPWLRTCWGGDARPGVTGPQRILGHSEAGIIDALDGMFHAAGAAAAADDDKRFWKLVLADVDDGTYGRYTLRRRRTGAALDQAASKTLLQANGLPVPMKEKEAAMLVSVT